MRNNPYIGPRPFERSDRDRFFGRARETRDLLALILAERVVLFYAQSGAGKTSLLNTQIVPALEEEGFHVLPVARVGGDVPRGIEAASVKNIFALSALLSLAGPQSEMSLLYPQTLRSFLASATDDEHPPIIIFDQFEEILTTHRDRWKEAHGFFEQLRDALQAMPRLGVILAMREDYVARLDPYAPLLPKRLKTRFRMERLGYAGALEAIKQPAAKAGVPFAPEVAEQLADDLRRIKAAQFGGAGQDVLGPYVEPVQLQVICSQLWENLPEQADQRINAEDVREYGNVDLALTGYYEHCVELASTATSVRESDLRHWFVDKLITPMQTRGLVLRGEKETAGLTNVAVDYLESMHIISSDVRAGARWYEISHDRLVDPIIQSNRAWEQARQTPLRTTAQNWQQSQNADLLYGGRALFEAEQWAAAYPAEVEDYEREFIIASQLTQRTKARNRKVRLTATAALAFALLIMVGLTVLAFQSRNQARRQAELALAKSLAAQSQVIWADTGDSLVQSALLAVEAMRRQPDLNGDQSLRRALNLLPQPITSTLHAAGVNAVAYHPKLPVAASGSQDGVVKLWNTEIGEVIAAITHTNPISAVIFSPDGKWGASASAEAVRVWDAASGSDVAQFKPSGAALKIAFSPNSQLLASANADGHAQVWDMATRQQVAEFVHDGEVRSIAFSPDGERVVTGSAEQTARVWNLATGQEITRVKHDGAVNVAAFSPDGRQVLSGGDDKTARVSDAVTGREVARLVHEGAVLDAAYSPDGKSIVSGGNVYVTLEGGFDVVIRNGDLRVWSSETDTELLRKRLPDWTLTVAFSPDGAQVATASRDGTARVWDVQANREVVRVVHAGPVTAIAFSPEGQYLLSGSVDHLAQVWAASAQQEVARLPHSDMVWTVRFISGKKGLLTASTDILTRSEGGIWQLPSGQQSVRVPSEVHCCAVDFSPNGAWLATGSAEGWLQLSSVASIEKPSIQDLFRVKFPQTIWAVAFSPDSQLIAAGDQSGLVQVIDRGSGQATQQFHANAPVWSVSISPDKQLLAVGDNEGHVQVWNLVGGQQVATMQHEDRVGALAFSPDGKLLASGGYDSMLHLWDTVTWREVAQIKFPNAVRSMAFNVKGDFLATGINDGSVRVWNIATREEVARMRHDDYVNVVTFSPDGKWIASSSFDKTARVWQLLPEDLIEAACARLPRNLTRAEWQRYLGEEPYRASCPNLTAAQD